MASKKDERRSFRQLLRGRRPARRSTSATSTAGATFGREKDAAEAELAEGPGAPGRPAGPAVGRGEARGPRRHPGDRRGRQGRHDPGHRRGLQPAGDAGHLVQGPLAHRAGPRLPVAGPPAGSRQGRDRDLQPEPLRGGAGRAGPRARTRGALAQALRAHPRLREDAHRRGRDDRQVLPGDRPRRAARSASRTGSTIRPSAGSSASATSRSGSAGTTTGRPSRRCSRRRRRAYAPWYLVPANRNWLRNLAVGEILADTLDDLEPAYPPAEEGAEGVTVE